MGYLLNSLGNLPIDDSVTFYIFVVNGQWQEQLYGMMDQNFGAIAKSIGDKAVIAKGLSSAEWTSEIARVYLGAEHEKLFKTLPALLLTDSHPSKLTPASLRLIVPLRDVEERIGGWPRFFELLSSFARGESEEFLTRFKAKDDKFDALNRVIDLKPNVFGVGINLNAFIEEFRKRKQESTLSG